MEAEVLSRNPRNLQPEAKEKNAIAGVCSTTFTQPLGTLLQTSRLLETVQEDL
jgi:hypothetical protein